MSTHVHTNGIKASGITLSGSCKATIIIAVPAQYVHAGQQVVRKEGRVSICLKFSNDKLKHKVPLAASKEIIPLIKLSPTSETKLVLYEQQSRRHRLEGSVSARKI